MSGTTTGIIVFVVAIVVSLAAWLIGVALAARRPGQEHPKQDQIRGLVQGGQHVGGGRSVGPTRDAPVPEGAAAIRLRRRNKTGPRGQASSSREAAARWTCDAGSLMHL
jgi:hypothetical protein